MGMKLGLLIQGPIFSPGYGPYVFNADGSYEKHWIDYDSRGNVLEMVTFAANFFDQIVISTWDTDENRNFLSNVTFTKNVSCVYVQETEKLKNFRAQGNHKYHQIMTMYEGASKLNQLGCDFIAKIRTDQNLDLRELFRLCANHRHRNQNSIGVPYINLFELDRLTDFYFVGRSDVISNTCKWYLETPEAFTDIHKDYFRKFANFLSDKPRGQEITVLSAWTKIFYPLSPRLQRKFFWRGLKVNNRVNGWLRWYCIFHSTKKIDFEPKLLMNKVLIFTLRTLIYPTIKPVSFIKFRLYKLVSKCI